MKTWFTITNKASDPAAEIDIFNEIGVWGVTAKDFANALKQVPKDREILLRINSPGGSIFDGHAIYNMLAERRDKVVAKVIGIAASMASIIMLAGRRVIAAENAVIMIHNPAASAGGDSDDMRKMADLLDKLKTQLVAAYVKKTGKTEKDVTDAMDETTWFTAAEAKDWGLVDEVGNAVKAVASFDINKFGAVPDRITNLFTGGVTASTNHQTQVSMKNLLAVLVEAKLLASADLSDDAAAALVRAALANQSAQAKAVADENTTLKSQLEAANKKVEAANKELATALKARADSAIDAAVKAGKIKDDKDVRAKWVEAYVANEEASKALLASLAEQKPARGSAPIVTTQAPKTESDQPVLTGRARVAAAFSQQLKENN
jgi:ATP-dependent Clp endopeptidase proteolytic subunit ClpP